MGVSESRGTLLGSILEGNHTTLWVRIMGPHLVQNGLQMCAEVKRLTRRAWSTGNSSGDWSGDSSGDSSICASFRVSEPGWESWISSGKNLHAQRTTEKGAECEHGAVEF